MASRDDTTRKELEEAVAVSPDNVPLRKHLAALLMRQGQPAEAEKHYRHAIALSPHDTELKLGVARAFWAQGRTSEALVAAEDLATSPHAPAEGDMLLARILAHAGEAERAVFYYRRALEADETLADKDLAGEIGYEGIERWTDDEGRVRLEAGEVLDDDIAIEMERPGLRFDDVGGMETLKDEIRMKIVHPLQHPELYEAYGKKVGGGILMYGPPGCGKTYLARATAGEVQAGFISVGLSDVLDMYLGQSEQKLHAIFEYARQHTPCVLFFDEVDALGARRSDMKKSFGRTVINQFLAELDGVDRSNEGVLVLAATNAPWYLDTAFRRPGRFDRLIFVPPPDAPGREAILDLHVRGKPTDSLDLAQIASKTPNFSGADLRSLVDLAVEDKLRDAIARGVPEPIRTRDLQRAAKKIKPVTKEWFQTARNYALYANENGMYDDVLEFLKKR